MDHFNEVIYQWYREHQRNLPWRLTSDPYLIWISETILQQTRISQGLPYYCRFTERYPDVRTLAESPPDELMKIWEGLGYYSRARNLHIAAKTILNELNGHFPRDYSAIRQLRGVGEYTASAVASIAFNLPYAVVDGNVNRLLCRYFGIEEAVDTTNGKKIIREKAYELLDLKDPGFHNQAVMEFGALCCVPKNPGCGQCPLSSRCIALRHNMVNLLPVKSRKVKRRIRHFTYFLIENENHLILEKRNGNDIWKNLYQFPMIETPQALSDQEIVTHPFLRTITGHDQAVVMDITPPYRHELTHQQIIARFIRVYQQKLAPKENWMEINKKEIPKFAYPALIRDFLAKTKITNREMI